MKQCIRKNEYCKNLKILRASKGNSPEKSFFGCSLFPECSYTISLYYDENLMSDSHKKLARAFGLFISSNNFIFGTYGVVYFNLRQAAFMDYLLRKEMVIQDGTVEIGLTGAKIYYSLFYHLLLIPSVEIKHYLINNFPESYNLFLNTDIKPIFFNEGIDYQNNCVKEEVFIQYSDIETYNR